MVLAGLFVALLSSAVASADGLPVPKGPVLLTIDGAITKDNGSHKARFDLEMLKISGFTRYAP